MIILTIIINDHTHNYFVLWSQSHLPARNNILQTLSTLFTSSLFTSSLFTSSLFTSSTKTFSSSLLQILAFFSNNNLPSFRLCLSLHSTKTGRGDILRMILVRLWGCFWIFCSLLLWKEVDGSILIFNLGPAAKSENFSLKVDWTSQWCFHYIILTTSQKIFIILTTSKKSFQVNVPFHRIFWETVIFQAHLLPIIICTSLVSLSTTAIVPLDGMSRQI